MKQLLHRLDPFPTIAEERQGEKMLHPSGFPGRIY